ncbi:MULTISPECIES: hypothetical protein [unclassified Streptomyces]|uniref:hypothetical protein n=1 Tax=unclassified Streptomyces TaxID=2593676 RepID=UPI0003821A79|nr:MULTISPECIES: hypothetical protein [unclassified Streptomyces]MYX35517.1 hypothetical protein [Streptomyces sp. SID8377]
MSHVQESGTGARGGAPRRRGPADPVRALMHRHQRLCAEAVDPLEIVAGLEAQGVTDRVAAGFRHRDVFTLAEELYARVPRAGAPPAAGRPVRRPALLLTLAPGAVCAAASGALHALSQVTVVAVAVPLLLLSLLAALRRGPLRAPYGTGPGGAVWSCWLVVFGLYGPRAVDGLAGGALPAADAAELTALALSLAPAAWCAHRFAVRSRAHLLRSRTLEEFGGAVRPLLAGTLALFLACALVLLCAARALTGAPLTPAALAGPAALALLLFTARLLAVHGHPDPAAIGTGLACAAEAVALAAALLDRFPLPPGAVPALACGAAALALAAHALTTLSRASAYTAAAAPR